MDIDFHFLQPAVVTAAPEDAGFTIESTLQRTPYSDVEHPSQRAYILARKPW